MKTLAFFGVFLYGHGMNSLEAVDPEITYTLTDPDVLQEYGLSEGQVSALPEQVVYWLALESSFMKRVFENTEDIERVIEEETGLTSKAQAAGRQAILGGAEKQGLQLNRTDDGYTLRLTAVGQQKLIEEIEKVRHGSGNHGGGN